MVLYGGPQAFADQLTASSGRAAAVAYSGGSSLSHWVTPALAPSLGVGVFGELVASGASGGFAVLALGTNDARLMVKDPLYTEADYVGSLNTAIDSSLTDARCVILVNTSTRAGQAHLAKRNAVNSQMRGIDTRGGRVRLADWDAHSSAQSGWFSSDSIHHTAAGSAAFRAFIGQAVVVAGQTPPCGEAPPDSGQPVEVPPDSGHRGVPPDSGLRGVPSPGGPAIPAPPKSRVPTVKKTPPPSVVLSKTKLVLRLSVRPQARKPCPTTVTVKVSAKGFKSKRVKVRARKTSTGCSIAKTVNLGRKASRLRSAKVTISGKGLKARKLTARRAAAS